ncbi:unnamed protein product, partial [marine sediment metagenome]
TSMRISGDVDYFLRVLQHGDLAVVGSIGCDITVHAGQEGTCLADDTSVVMNEIFAITERYRPLLDQAGIYRRVQQQLGAYALGLAFKYWRMGLKDACHSYREIVRMSGVRKIEVLLAVLRLLSLRLILKITGIRLVPVHPSQSLRHKNAC